MSGIEIAFLCAVIVGTSFLSGLFGMAGGIVLVGVLLAMLPVPAAMALHAVTQIASNGWRGLLWIRFARFPVAFNYMMGALATLAVWSIWRYIPPAPLAMLLIGIVPFTVYLVPEHRRPNPDRRIDGVVVGIVCMALMLTTGVSGPLLDAFFLGGSFDRRGKVATKAVCQCFGHAVKLLYFGAIVDASGTLDPLVAGLAVVSAAIGTTLARKPLEKMGETFFIRWSRRIIYALSAFYVVNGLRLMAMPA
ncbi:MAG: sulfite exporter TauE/SafE family protein [Rhodospirillales bacterium]|nr:sulfite exporter TauE/SafE family protein [Rhodospirillales bacterium]